MEKSIRLLTLLFLLGLVFGYVIGWTFRNDGKVIASSQRSRLPGEPRIIIREIPESGSFFGVQLDIFDDNPRYRFEYYTYTSSSIYSCRTFIDRSYRANNAEIEWETSGVATVMLDHSPKFKCDQQGIWHGVDD